MLTNDFTPITRTLKRFPFCAHRGVLSLSYLRLCLLLMLFAQEPRSYLVLTNDLSPTHRRSGCSHNHA